MHSRIAILNVLLRWLLHPQYTQVSPHLHKFQYPFITPHTMHNSTHNAQFHTQIPSPHFLNHPRSPIAHKYFITSIHRNPNPAQHLHKHQSKTNFSRFGFRRESYRLPNSAHKNPFSSTHIFHHLHSLKPSPAQHLHGH